MKPAKKMKKQRKPKNNLWKATGGLTARGFFVIVRNDVGVMVFEDSKRRVIMEMNGK